MGNITSGWIDRGAAIARRNDFLRAFVKILYAGGGYRLFSLKKARIPLDGGTKRQVFADVSGIVKKDLGTGIQRTTRNLVYELGKILDNDTRLVPVYAEPGRTGYNEASLSEGDGVFRKTARPIAVKRDDIFLGIDHVSWITLSQLAAFRAMGNMGVKLRFLVYDLIPINHPQWFRAGDKLREAAWLKELAPLGKFIAISETVKNELEAWASENAVSLLEKPGWIHMGYSGRELIRNSEEAGITLPEKPFFLVVGSIEPRKGHQQTLEAFRLLWREGFPYALVFVGREGWKMENFCQDLRGEANRNQNFVWLDDCSDAMLAHAYKAATALIMPTFAEGFGMPLVEAAANGKPLILRDLPVFREIAGDNAIYFKGAEPADLAHVLEKWLEPETARPTGGQIPVKSWRECAESLLLQCEIC